MAGHIPVLLQESIEALNIRPDGTYVDLTLGRGGHSEAIAEKLDGGRLFCFDKDEEAIEAAADRLARFGDKITFIKSDFREISKQLDQREVHQVDGILMDLGDPHPNSIMLKGIFIYWGGTLDMRMDRQSVMCLGYRQ